VVQINYSSGRFWCIIQRTRRKYFFRRDLILANYIFQQNLNFAIANTIVAAQFAEKYNFPQFWLGIAGSIIAAGRGRLFASLMDRFEDNV